MTMRVPIPPEMEKIMQKYAKYLQQKLPPNTGFAIFIAPFGEDPKGNWVFYISNVDREGMLSIVSNYMALEGN